LGDSIPSEKEFLKISEGLSREGILSAVKLVKELLDDDEEDLAPQDRKILVEVLAETQKRLKDPKLKPLTAAGAYEGLEYGAIQEFFNQCHTEKDGRFCDDGPGKSGVAPEDKKGRRIASDPTREGNSIQRRLRSLTPAGMRSSYYKKGSAFQNEYNYGKYNWKYRPSNVQQAKRKRVKSRNSRARWTAAALLSFPLMVVGPYRRRMLSILETKKDTHRTAKRQHRSYLIQAP